MRAINDDYLKWPVLNCFSRHQALSEIPAPIVGSLFHDRANATLSRCATDREAGEFQCRLSDPYRHALAILAAGADTGIQRHVIADHGNLGQAIWAIAD